MKIAKFLISIMNHRNLGTAID